MSYIHGTEPEEQQRLLILNQLLNTRCLTKLNFEGHERVLDIGSGLGVFSRLMAHLVPEGQVVGVEYAPQQYDRALRLAADDGEHQLVSFRRGSAYELPLHEWEWGSFDLVFMRFVLEHLTQPYFALQQAWRALKSGGMIVLVDDDHEHFRITPPNPGFELLWPEYMRVYEQLNLDPRIGRHLITMLYQAGFDSLALDFILFGAAAGEADFSHYANNLQVIIREAKDQMISPGGLHAQEFEQAMEQIRLWAQRPDAALWYLAPWAQGLKP